MRAERVVPKGIVNTSKANSSTAKIERSNSSNGLLFKLPSKLRNRIWNLVFDIGSLHISYESWSYNHRFPKRICVAEQNESEAAQDIRELQTYDPSKLFSRRHHACMASTEWKIFSRILDVLRVSRQVHAEAALLPYQLNTFYFNSYKAFSRFRNGLGSDHRRAVRSVGFELTPTSLYDPSPPQMRDMCGLQNLFVFLSASQSALVNEVERSKQGTEDLGIPALKELLRADLDLQSVSVTIYHLNQVSIPPVMQHIFMHPNELDTVKNWSVYMEQKLLKAGEDKSEKTKKRTRSGKGFAGRETKKLKTG